MWGRERECGNIEWYIIVIFIIRNSIMSRVESADGILKFQNWKTKAFIKSVSPGSVALSQINYAQLLWFTEFDCVGIQTTHYCFSKINDLLWFTWMPIRSFWIVITSDGDGTLIKGSKDIQRWWRVIATMACAILATVDKYNTILEISNKAWLRW